MKITLRTWWNNGFGNLDSNSSLSSMGSKFLGTNKILALCRRPFKCLMERFPSSTSEIVKVSFASIFAWLFFKFSFLLTVPISFLPFIVDEFPLLLLVISENLAAFEEFESVINSDIIKTCGVVDLRSSEALRRETKHVNAQ